MRVQKGKIEEIEEKEQHQHGDLVEHRHHQQHHGGFRRLIPVKAHEQHLEGLSAAGRRGDGAEEKFDEVVLEPAQRPHRPSHAMKEHRRAAASAVDVQPHAQKPQADQPGGRASEGRQHRLHVAVAQEPPEGRPDQRGEKEKLQKDVAAGLSVHRIHNRPYYTTAAARLQRAAPRSARF